jgi:hypothetical protein
MTTNGSWTGMAAFETSPGKFSTSLAKQASQTWWHYKPEFPVSANPNMRGINATRYRGAFMTIEQTLSCAPTINFCCIDSVFI